MTKIDNTSYTALIETLKQEISNARTRAHLAVNKELVTLYWKIGKQILERQEKEGWGAKVLEKVSEDLRREFLEMRGFSTQNLKYMRKFSEIYNAIDLISQQAVDQIPWGHIVKVIYDIKDDKERLGTYKFRR